jgi:riboflavin kinase/FMN adenylyltransferase
MEIVRIDAARTLSCSAPALAIGNFDGVHLGHQALVRAAVEEARRQAGTAMVLTFDPHPVRVLAPERAPRALLTLEQRAELLGALGIEVVAVLGFDAEIAALEPEQFVRAILVRALQARSVVVGERFRFGRGRAGDVPLLARLGDEGGFRVHAHPVVLQDGEPVSSSRIRELLGRGDVQAAARLLGRAFFVDGTVVRGDGRGRLIGIPTANLETRNETLPAPGVYAGFAHIAKGGERWPCVANLGERPTFGGSGLRLEAHLLDYEGELLGRELRLEFARRLREERRFESAAALVEQIRKDVADARASLEL